MPRTTNVKPYGGGNPDNAEATSRRPPLEKVQIPALELTVRELEAQVADVKVRKRMLDDFVAQMVFVWPWSVENAGEVGRLLAASNLPEWAKEVAAATIADIRTGELVNTWQNPFIS